MKIKKKTKTAFAFFLSRGTYRTEIFKLSVILKIHAYNSRNTGY